MLIARVITFAVALGTIAECQTPIAPKPEFEAVSIKAAAPQTGHFRSPPSSTGGPGTTDPSMFRCPNCTVEFLITKAFALEPYQLPGRASLPDAAFDVTSRVPDGASVEQFASMLQDLLKDRFGLSYHFDNKPMQGYELVVAPKGPKLKESNPAAVAEAPHGDVGANWHSAGGHEMTRPGLMVRNGQASYRGDSQTMQDLARTISAQLAKPVDDHTGLKGKYDILLTWSDDGAHAASHPGGWSGGSWDHGSATPAAGTGSAPDAGPTGQGLIGAVQNQLGLKLEPKKASAAIFVVDHIEKAPTAN